MSPPLRILQWLSLLLRWGKDCKSLVQSGRAPFSTLILSALATLAFTQTSPLTPSAFQPQGLCTCCSRTGTLLFTVPPHNESYLSRLTPVPQFSPPPGHPPCLPSLGKFPLLCIVANHPLTWPRILNAGHILESHRESFKNTDAQTPA